jgi:hypothetical protein
MSLFDHLVDNGKHGRRDDIAAASFAAEGARSLREAPEASGLTPLTKLIAGRQSDDGSRFNRRRRYSA